MSHYPSFSEFAAKRLNATVCNFNEAAAETFCFAAAREGAMDLMSWTTGMRNIRGDQLNIQSGYLQLFEPNAVADTYQDGHFIGIHQTLFESIVEFALFAFTQKYVFPKIGDVNAEDSPEPIHGEAPGLFLLQKYLEDQHLDAATDRHRIPNDKTRGLFAVYLGVLMARFVWFHEMAHCLNGHVLFAQESGLATRLYEVEPSFSIADLKNKTPETIQHKILRHGLEFDADNTAFLALCRVQIFNGENLDGLKSLDLTTRLELSIFAAYATTWLFEEYNNFKAWTLSGTHPSPYDRVMNISGSAVRILAKQNRGFKKIHNNVCKQFNHLIKVIPTLYQLDMLGNDTTHPNFTTEKRIILEGILEEYRFTD